MPSLPQSTGKRPASFDQVVVWLLVFAGVALVVVFGLRSVRSYVRVQRAGFEAANPDPAAIRGWMTVPYLAQVFEVPEEDLFAALEIPEAENRKRSLREINLRYWPDQPGFPIARLQEVIRRYHPVDPSIEPTPP